MGVRIGLTYRVYCDIIVVDSEMMGCGAFPNPFADIRKFAHVCANLQKGSQMNKLFYSLVVSCVFGLIPMLGGCATESVSYQADGRWMSEEEYKQYRLERPYVPPVVVEVERPAPPVNNPPMYRWADGSVHDTPEISLAAEMEKMKALPPDSPGVKSSDWPSRGPRTHLGELVYLGSGSSPTPPPGLGEEFDHVIAVPSGNPVVRGVCFPQPTRLYAIGGGVVVGGADVHYYGTNHDYWGPNRHGSYYHSNRVNVTVGVKGAIVSGLNDRRFRNRDVFEIYGDDCDDDNRGRRGGGRGRSGGGGQYQHGTVFIKN